MSTSALSTHSPGKVTMPQGVKTLLHVQGYRNLNIVTAPCSGVCKSRHCCTCMFRGLQVKMLPCISIYSGVHKDIVAHTCSGKGGGGFTNLDISSMIQNNPAAFWNAYTHVLLCSSEYSSSPVLPRTIPIPNALLY